MFPASIRRVLRWRAVAATLAVLAVAAGVEVLARSSAWADPDVSPTTGRTATSIVVLLAGAGVLGLMATWTYRLRRNVRALRLRTLFNTSRLVGWWSGAAVWLLVVSVLLGLATADLTTGVTDGAVVVWAGIHQAVFSITTLFLLAVATARQGHWVTDVVEPAVAAGAPSATAVGPPPSPTGCA